MNKTKKASKSCNQQYSFLIRNRILELCELHNTSINHLALIAGLRTSTVSSIIDGKSKNPSIITLHRIANAFCMTLSDFLDFPEMNEYEFTD